MPSFTPVEKHLLTELPNSRMQSAAKSSILLVGAGLASALIAHRLSRLDETLQITIVEATEIPFGAHTWSFHAHDVTPHDMAWLSPLIAHQWSRQKVKFEPLKRDLQSGYASLTSQSVASVVATNPRVTIVTGAAVASVDPHGASLVDGRRFEAGCVIDARGISATA